MRDEITGITPRPNATAALSPYLTSDNEVLRCAATKALTAVAAGEEQAKSRLEDALLDPDPDVRSDAMAGFACLATPEDATTLRRSLEGDPVREVKLSAIEALARLEDTASVDLLRSLVLSRAEDRVAWEDEGGDWEDWLDIQIAAIAALGRMRAQNAIDDVLAARDDEFGQTLDHPVFTALAQMGEEGTVWLLAVAKTETGLARKRAVEVLADMAPEALRDHAPDMLGSEDPALRKLAIRLLDPSSTEAGRIVKTDPSEDVRLAVLEHCLAAQPDLAKTALQDASPAVQAAGLSGLRLPLDSEFHDALVDNMLVWIERGDPAVMVATVQNLPHFAPNRAGEPLSRLIPDANRPLEARVAAVRALALVRPEVTTTALAELLENSAQQVRVAVLTLIRARAEVGDETAIDTIAEAISGALLPDQARSVVRPEEPDALDVAAPKGEGSGPSSIRITRNGDIVAASEEDDIAGTSTLSSILAPMADQERELAEQTPEETSGKRRKRRPVEGPDAVAAALMREALSVCGKVSGARIEAAILRQTLAEDADLRRAAWQALRARCTGSDICTQARHAADRALADGDPVIRLSAFDVLCAAGPSESHVTRALSDPDALICATALEYVPPETALQYLTNDAQPVRRAALGRIMTAATVPLIFAAVDSLTTAERADTLGDLMRVCPEARAKALADLASDRHPPRQALVVLDALSHGGASEAQDVIA